jgi:hypothetical protein
MLSKFSRKLFPQFLDIQIFYKYIWTNSYFCAAVIAIGILSGRLACGNGNEKTLVLQWTNKKSKARKNKLIVANQVLLKDNYVSNVIKQKVLRKYLKNAKMC